MLISNEVLKKIIIAILTIAQKNKSRFDERDVKRVGSTKWWGTRFALVSQDENEAIESLTKCLDWRKSYRINDMNDNIFPKELNSVITIDKKDKDGRPLLWFNLNRFVPSDPTFKLIKEFTAYKIEVLDRQTSYEGWGAMIDATGGGISNVDLDYFYTLISVLQSYYPYGPKYVMPINLPFILDATFRTIIAFSSQEMSKRFKSVGKAELKEYLNPQYIPDHLKDTGDSGYGLGSLLG